MHEKMNGEVRILTLPTAVIDHVDTRLEEGLYSGALTLLTSHFTASATSSVYSLPPPSHLAILTTMLVHPSTTNTPSRREASHLLSRVLDVTSPQSAKFDQVWEFGRKRKRRENYDDDEDESSNILIEESLFAMADNVWDVIEWAFYQSRGGWVDLMSHVVRLLRNDFEAKAKTIDRCLLVAWLKDRSEKAVYQKAVRAATATPGRQMMLDTPRPIYPTEIENKEGEEVTDIWGGSIPLSQRIELLSMLYELARLRPKFLDENLFLNSLYARIISLTPEDLYSLLSNIPSRSFRLAVCELTAQQLSPESSKAIHSAPSTDENLAKRIIEGYIPFLPPSTGREAAPDLAKYCIVSGMLLRVVLLYKEDQRYSGVTGIVERAIRRREERLEGWKLSVRSEVEGLINREGMMMRVLARRIEANNAG